MAHFMGVSGAAKLIANAEDNPQTSGARLFPNAAAANRPIFYDSDGRARSVSEVYADLGPALRCRRHSPATRMAMTSDAILDAIRPSGLSVTPARRARRCADRGIILGRAKPADVPFAVSGRRRTQPVSPVVQELWGRAIHHGAKPIHFDPTSAVRSVQLSQRRLCG